MDNYKETRQKLMVTFHRGRRSRVESCGDLCGELVLFSVFLNNPKNGKK